MRNRSRGRFGMTLTAVVIAAASCAPGEDPAPLTRDAEGVPVEPAAEPERGMAWVTFNGDTVRAEIAYTDQDRARGLMHREELADGEGMIFVFDDVDRRSFWMQDTHIPLDIAFLDEEYRIVDIQQMEPLTTDTHESAEPAMFALEVPQGWFERQGIQVGDVARVVFGRF